jgi:hypothetical protein
MSILRTALAASAVFALCQCETPLGQIDARNPSVSEQDALDVQWGLTPRKSRGSPRRMAMPSAASSTAAAEPAPAAAAPAAAAASEPAPAASSAPAPTSVTPEVLNGLR